MADDDQQREQIREQRKQTAQKMSVAIRRAVDDPEFRQRFLNDPRSALGAAGDIPTRQAPARFRELRVTLFQQVIDRAGSNQEFRDQLEKEPRKALWDAGFGPQIEQLRAEIPQEEVRGYTAAWWGGEWIWQGLIGWGGGWGGGGGSWGGGWSW